MFNRIELSFEQQYFIDKVIEGKNVLVDACIGSGKTTSIQRLCDNLPTTKKILYLTYNKLLKTDAQNKIRNRNVKVTNYHGFAFEMLNKSGFSFGVSDLIQEFNNRKPLMGKYDLLVIDEYQDIDTEISTMLEIIKSYNPGIQIVAVGDMAQKIYDKTSLKVEYFIKKFLGEHVRVEFTQCFRLSNDIASKLGRIWGKDIVGVNNSCEVMTMGEKEIIDFLSRQKVGDILCLGQRTGMLANTLNTLETKFPQKFNKNTTYATIRSGGDGYSNPKSDSAIFTTFDGSKGLERDICVVFDYTDSYWENRISKPGVKYDILRNIFLVAASRGKKKIIFVENDERDLIEEETLSTSRETNLIFEDMAISEMYDFKFQEDINRTYALLDVEEIEREDKEIIEVNSTDGLIDLSPCIGTYQEAYFFKNYNIEQQIDFLASTRKFAFKVETDHLSLDQKILLLTSLDTNQDRYRKQVMSPFVSGVQRNAITERLLTVFTPFEKVQQSCSIVFKDGDFRTFNANGYIDVIKDETVFELKFKSSLEKEDFLQTATYMVATGLDKGILWNTKDNTMYKVSVPNKQEFLDSVVKTITKGVINKYQ